MNSKTFSKNTPFSEPLSNRIRHASAQGKSGCQVSSEKLHRGQLVLLVEDDLTVSCSVDAVLVSEGYNVITAANGEKALEFAGKYAVDLVLLDLNLPVKNGWDTFETLTAEHPLMPIIIITARPNQRFTALAAGVGALMEKPLDIPVLLRTMEKLLAEPAERRLARLVGKEAEFHCHTGTREANKLLCDRMPQS